MESPVKVPAELATKKAIFKTYSEKQVDIRVTRARTERTLTLRLKKERKQRVVAND